jgi:hypothetical protein
MKWVCEKKNKEGEASRMAALCLKVVVVVVVVVE